MAIESPLFSPDLQQRYQASITQPQSLEEHWPLACSGAANAFLVLIGPSMGRAGADQIAQPGGANRPLDGRMTIGPEVMKIDWPTSRTWITSVLQSSAIPSMCRH